MGTPRHPAKFNDAILNTIARAIPPDRFRLVLDPFAGTGRIHELPNETVGIELEPEWAAMHECTLEGDALTVMRLERDGTYDAIATSPCYGNRMADDHTPSPEDTSTRNTYRHALGRPLSYGTSANMQWGPQYREFHETVWAEAVRVLRVGGRFVLNIKDHIRDGVVQPVSGWHITILCRLGLRLVEMHPVASKGNRQGANGDARVDHEWVVVFVKDPLPAPTLQFPQRPAEAYVRSSDPATSKKAAAATATSWRTGTQNVSMLIAWYEAEVSGRDGLTAEEAATITGMAAVPRCCWWHRASDNKACGTVVPTGDERPGMSKHDREVLRITPHGMEMARSFLEQGATTWTWKR